MENLKFISHRGNLNGKDERFENHPDQIIKAIKSGFDVEVDVWNIDNKWVLGHDKPLYEIEYKFLQDSKLWCHLKNLDAVKIVGDDNRIHWFWHQNDTLTLTSYGYIWGYTNLYIENSKYIINQPDDNFDFIGKKFFGICHDKIVELKEKLTK